MRACQAINEGLLWEKNEPRDFPCELSVDKDKAMLLRSAVTEAL